ncbi:unnamed protein product [[Actinomadura] parvosata subsp. kistnae]|uniref:ATP-grasp domain-containing protein n=1 Tax=[Actinomadura] parvosata subsp. kistnae TaxID=1909395 RepID=A0A1V0ADG9_9ACTN|nr:ATP-grasp domain-containing protein [Nonomuraea sp. ATCC 55076]AQZ68236.1 hypothetical protein BKM31_48275 [Nonomuraea sp. ATCC 55076]SPL93356.1 unnamed protein product [Actinomadura parvosata subsp. kistnae]
MRILLSDGSGLTSRQCATLLSRAGHAVEVLSPDRLCVCAFTRHVRRVHRVPAFGHDPFAWLDSALEVYAAGAFDVLLPTQEQVAVLSLAADRLREQGVATVVPPFAALAMVQDKVSAFHTLTRLGLPQPRSAVITGAAAAWDAFPAYAKRPIGTATSGVRRLTGHADLDGLEDGVLVQEEVPGPLVMVQAVFAAGEPIAFHACVRAGEGARGGAGRKRSVLLPEVRRHVQRLGGELRWHGALSADVILGPDGPVVIDVNPRLVEPVNALLSGVDLVTPLLDLARGRPPVPQPASVPGVRTHQLLLAVLGAAEHAGRRGAILAELAAAATRKRGYAGSREELIPGFDPPGTLLLALATTATLIRPDLWRWFASGSVAGYALSPAGWRRIVEFSRTRPGSTAGTWSERGDRRG